MPGLTAFREFEKDEVFACVTSLIKRAGSFDESDLSDAARRYFDCMATMAEAAERYGLCGNVWQSWLAMLFIRCETVFALAHELSAPREGTLKKLAAEDISELYLYMHYDLNRLDRELKVSAFGILGDYTPLSPDGRSFDNAGNPIVLEFAAALREAARPSDLYNEITNFYARHGCGQFAINKAFRWDARMRRIVAVTHTDDILLSSLIGYEEQKRTLIDNTVAFLEGRPANNVLLYGESGTGKSSSVKALLNEFAPRGLRMIEVYKHQIEDLNEIVDILKVRNYKFIIFMDDLSFEEFETEYKYLKAFIEGGLEKRPDNVLIYATSNRRHLMRELWSDRSDMYDDMHESETMQERLSLVDRFGLMIRYFSPEQEEYLHMVRKLAEEYGVDSSRDDLDRGAIQWELKHGGFSGRSARQYVEFLAGRKPV